MRAGCGFLLFVFIVFPLLLIFIVLAGVSTWALDRGFYQDVLSQPAFYEEALDDAIIDWNGEGLPEALADVPPEALTAGLREVVTAEYLQSQMASAVDQLFDMLEGRTDQFIVSFDLTPIKAALQGDGAEAFATAYVGALPPCRPTGNGQAVEGGLPLCMPSGISESRLIAQVVEALPAVAQSLPDEISTESSVTMPEVQGTRLQPGMINSLMTTGLTGLGVVAVVIWFINGFIGAQTVRSRFLWLGATLLIPAAVVLIGGITLNAPTVESAIRESLTQNDGAAAVQLADNAGGSMLNAVSQVRTGFIIAGGIPTLVAVLLLIVGLTIRPRIKPKNDARYVQVPAR